MEESKDDSVSPTATKSKLHVIHPRHEIFETRPQVRWGGSRTAREYVVRLFPKSETKGKEIFIENTRGRSLPWPVKILPLRPGVEYVVEINAASGANDIIASATFTVVSGERRTQIQKDFLSMDRMLGKRPNILRGELLRQHGLHAECREELERLRVSETENVSLLRRLRVAFKALGLTEEANRMSRLIGKRR